MGAAAGIASPSPRLTMNAPNRSCAGGGIEMTRQWCALVLLFLVLPDDVRAAPPDDPTARPITTDPTPVGQLLKKWHGEGTAAGNVGDWYDNRDGEHSP